MLAALTSHRWLQDLTLAGVRVPNPKKAFLGQSLFTPGLGFEGFLSIFLDWLLMYMCMLHIDVNGVYKVCFEGVFFRKCGHFAMNRWILSLSKKKCNYFTQTSWQTNDEITTRIWVLEFLPLVEVQLQEFLNLMIRCSKHSARWPIFSTWTKCLFTTWNDTIQQPETPQSDLQADPGLPSWAPIFPLVVWLGAPEKMASVWSISETPRKKHGCLEFHLVIWCFLHTVSSHFAPQIFTLGKQKWLNDDSPLQVPLKGHRCSPPGYGSSG